MTTADLIAQLDADWAALQELRPRVEAGVPWPVSERFDTTAEAYWFPPEVLAHVSELLGRWLGVVDLILAGPEPAEFGQPNPARLAGIDHNRRLPLADLYGLIEAGVGNLRARLASLAEADLARRGRHVTRGETTVAELVAGSVTGHIAEHVRQIESLLAAAGR